jgi:hypothetical protein
LIRNVSKLNIPLEYLFWWNYCTKLRKAAKNHHPLDTLFSIRGGLFPPPTKTKNVIVPSVVFSLKMLEDHLFHSKDLLRWWPTFRKFFD